MPREDDREGLAALFLRLRSQESLPSRLLQVIEALPRRDFLPGVEGDVHADQSFPLPCGETAPSTAEIMRTIAALQVQPDSRILEVGTGSGYVTALLARLGARVASIERWRTLRDAAAERLKTVGCSNASVILDDGRDGYRTTAPYDRILVHGAFEEVPRVFLEQIASPGILVCAIGAPGTAQMLTRHHKAGSRFETEPVFRIRTQPLKPGVAAVL